MSFKTIDRNIVFTCDRCETELATDEQDFGEAVGVMKRQGWLVKKLFSPNRFKGAYKHFCDRCRELEEDDE